MQQIYTQNRYVILEVSSDNSYSPVSDTILAEFSDISKARTYVKNVNSYIGFSAVRIFEIRKGESRDPVPVL